MQPHNTEDPPLIWFLLVDSATGQIYKDTTTTSVFRYTCPVVDLLRDAVKAKYNEQGYLKDVPAGTLLVFKNKASFDKRSAAVVEDKEVPLDEDSPLVGLGKSKKEAIIVVVQDNAGSMQQDNSDPLGDALVDSFYRNIVDGTVENECWLKLSDRIPGSVDITHLYIRQSYKEIAASILAPSHELKKVIVSGTPGIGKSWFMFYLLWKLLNENENRRVLFIYDPYIIYYNGKGGVVSYKDVPSCRETFWNNDLWCLFDAKEKKSLSGYSYDTCNFIISMSPRNDLINDFKKTLDPSTFHMPIWSFQELESISVLYPKALNVWKERYETLGGIPRRLFVNISVDANLVLKNACNDCNLNDLIRLVGLDSIITEKSKVIHVLVHIHSASPFTSSSVSFASQNAMDLIIREKRVTDKDTMRDLLDSCSGLPLAAALCGHIFEPFAIEMLEKGGKFESRDLNSGAKKDIDY